MPGDRRVIAGTLPGHLVFFGMASRLAACEACLSSPLGMGFFLEASGKDSGADAEEAQRSLTVFARLAMRLCERVVQKLGRAERVG
jgi:hypothetical protein